MVLKFIEKAWKTYRKNLPTLIGAVILVFVITFAIFLLTFLPFFLTFLSFGAMEPQQMAAAGIMMSMFSPLNIVLAGIGIIAMAIVGTILGAGLIRLYYEALRNTKKVKIETVFKTAKDKFFPILGANALVWLIMAGVGTVLIIPGFYLMATQATVSLSVFPLILLVSGFIVTGLIGVLFILVNQAVVIGNKKAVDAVKQSVDIAKKNYTGLLGLVLIFLGLGYLVGLIPAIGEIISVIISIIVINPLGGLSYTYFYMKRKGKKG